jgi:hypothetical protein
MNSHLNHLVANERAADLRRRAELERLANGEPTAASSSRPSNRARAFIRLRLRVRLAGEPAPAQASSVTRRR